MGDQTQQMVIQKWYTKPQVLIPAAALGYMVYNKKTRKTALYLIAAAWVWSFSQIPGFGKVGLFGK
jgi:hypothetical protein